MEGVKIGTNNTSNKKKQNTVVSFNGGDGIGGIVVLGGAIAFAALVTFVANKRNKTKPTTKKDQSVDSELYRESKSYTADIDDDEIGSEGLQLFVQPESEPIVHLNHCRKSKDKAELGFDELNTTQNSIMEEIRLNETNGVKETVTRHNGDDDEDEEEDNKGSSEETGDSSMESNADPIWPTETLENLSMKLKENNFSHQELVVEKIGSEAVTEKNDISNEYGEMIAPKYEERSQIVQENNVNSRPRVGSVVMMMLVTGMMMLSLIVSLIKYYPHLFYEIPFCCLNKSAR